MNQSKILQIYSKLAFADEVRKKHISLPSIRSQAAAVIIFLFESSA